MKWINDVVFAILAAHVWGSLMLFVWLQTVKRLENKGYTRLLFYLLRAVIVAYLLPLGLGAVLIIMRQWQSLMEPCFGLRQLFQ